jgi:hypothetical protein
LANLGADRRLRAKHFFPGAGETALPGNFKKCDELIEIHELGGHYNDIACSESE